jgi:hypothetical protein
MSEGIETHVHAGLAFPGRRAVADVLKELERQKEARKDAVVRSDRLSLQVSDNQILLRTPVQGTDQLVPMNTRAWGQLLSMVGLPKRTPLYNMLMTGAKADSGRRRNTPEGKKFDPRTYWPTFTTMANDILQTEKHPLLVRLMDDSESRTYCRALLSDQYKIVPNDAYFYSIAEKLMEVGAEIWHARLSDDHFYGYAVSPGITGQITTDRTFDPGDGWSSRWYGKEGDVYNAAMAFGNSETGAGGCFIKQAILRRVCQNYCIYHDVVNLAHIGRRMGEELMLSEQTIMAENKVFFMKIGDYVSSTFDPERFQKMIDAINGAAKEAVDPNQAETVAENLMFAYDISQERMAQIKRHFYAEGDYSRLGLANAVTRCAHAETHEAEVGFDLENLGADVIATDLEKMSKRADVARKEKAKAAKNEAAVAVA